MAFLVAGVTLAAMQIAPGSLPAAPASPSGVTSFPATFFASSRPNTAFDMIARLPGFSFDAGERVRGFGGAAGNVLIDGRRPASKADTLDSILQRIPASSVMRIDVIRGGAPGIDMQGRTVLANVILVKAARTEVTATVAANAYSDGRLSPTVQLEAARSKGDTRLTGSVRRYEEEGGEQGSGFQILTDGAGNLIRDARASKKDVDHGIEVRGTSQFPALGGLVDINPSLDLTGTDQAERYAFAAPGGGIAHEAVIDTYRRKGGEIGADFSRDLSKRTQLKIVALQSLRYRTHDSSSDQDQTLTDFALKQTSGESILRATVTHQGSGAISLEAGAEGAFNFLDGNSTLRVDGAPVAIPNARARVTEKRGEAFATVTWKASSTIGVEGTAKVETSTIAETGDTRRSEHFLFPKPRVVVTWSPTAQSQVRLRVEREVGQLDFADFVATADLATGVVSAGNAKLEPERRWVIEAALERHFWGTGDIVLTLRHALLSQVIDQIPVEGFNAPGNIGDGRRDVAALSLALPLAKLGMKGGLLKADGQWLSSQVTDPTTGRRRIISGDEPFSGTLELTNDMPKLRSTWTIAARSAVRETYFFIDEIEVDRRAASLDLAWEYKPTSNWSILAQLTNVTGYRRGRFRSIYDGLRSVAPLAETERFLVDRPRAFYLRVRKTL